MINLAFQSGMCPVYPRRDRVVLACPREGNEDLIKDSACLHHSLIRKATYGALATPGKTETAQNPAFPPQCAAKRLRHCQCGPKVIERTRYLCIVEKRTFRHSAEGKRCALAEDIFPQDTVRGPRGDYPRPSPRLREAPKNSAQGLRLFVPPLNILPELGRLCNSAKG
jgi:hypothetical protein